MPGQPKTLEGVKLGSYSVLAEIGRGGMAVVYKGRQDSLNRSVAIKVLPLEFARTPELLRRFHREAEAMAALAHPNIVQIIDKGEREGVYYFVMEFVDGPSLKELLRDTDVTLERILELALMVAGGLEHAHAHGIVHRDLKPGNVLVERRSGIAKIADFGIAQLQSGAELSQLTSSHMAMGTLNYMAPEQKVDAKSVDHRADIYSFGVILYEMLTGDLPLGSFDPPSHVNKRIPRALDEIVLKCLKTSPQNRYQTIGECAIDLKEAREGAGDVGVITRAVKAVGEKAATAISGTFRSRRGRVVLGLLVVATVALGYVYYGAGYRFGLRSPLAAPKPPAEGNSQTTVATPKPPKPPVPAPDLLPETSDAIATKEQAARAELRVKYARKTAEAGDAHRYARDKFEAADRLAADGATLFADGTYGRAAAAFEEAIARFRASETAAVQGKQEEQAAVAARKKAEDARQHAEAEKAQQMAVERWTDAERAFERGKKAQEVDFEFDDATIAFKDAAKAYDDAASGVVARLRREQAIEAMERSSYDMTGARKRAELAGAANAAPDDWKRAEDAKAEAERVRAGGDPALAAREYERARHAYDDAEAHASSAADAAKLREDAAAARRGLDAARARADAAKAGELAGDAYAKAAGEADEGAKAFDQAHFEVARIHFQHAQASFDDAVAAAGHERASREVEAARVSMSGTRDQALQARARELAAKAFESASAEEHTGDEERVNGRLAEARARYEAAQKLYAQAAAAAFEADRRALEAARDELSDARFRAYDAGAHIAVSDVFQRAAAEERAGDDEKEKGHLLKARARYERAQALYLEAARAAAASTTVAAAPPPKPVDPISQPRPPVTPPPTAPPPAPEPVKPLPPAPPPALPPDLPPPVVRPVPMTAQITFRAAYVKAGRDAGDVVFPKSIACDPVSGGFWLADAKKGSVLRYTSDGAFRQELPGLSAPYDVASDGSGNLYAADAGTNEVIRIGADGRRLGKFGYRGAGVGELHFPNGVAVSPAGEVFVLDCGNKRAQRFTAEGRYLAQFPIVTEKYAGIAADAQGRVYVCAPREVKRFEAQGSGLGTTFAGGVQPIAVAVDSRGRVFVCDAVGARVLVLDPDGRKLAEVTTGEGGARLQYPIGVACDGARLYVVDVKAAKKVSVYDVR